MKEYLIEGIGVFEGESPEEALHRAKGFSARVLSFCYDLFEEQKVSQAAKFLARRSIPRIEVLDGCISDRGHDR